MPKENGEAAHRRSTRAGAEYLPVDSETLPGMEQQSLPGTLPDVSSAGNGPNSVERSSMYLEPEENVPVAVEPEENLPVAVEREENLPVAVEPEENLPEENVPVAVEPEERTGKMDGDMETERVNEINTSQMEKELSIQHLEEYLHEQLAMGREDSQCQSQKNGPQTDTTSDPSSTVETDNDINEIASEPPRSVYASDSSTDANLLLRSKPRLHSYPRNADCLGDYQRNTQSSNYVIWVTAVLHSSKPNQTHLNKLIKVFKIRLLESYTQKSQDSVQAQNLEEESVLSCVPVIVTVRNMRNAAAMDVDVSVWLHLQKSQDSVQAQNLEEESVLSCVPVIVTVRNMRNAAAMDVDVSVWLHLQKSQDSVQAQNLEEESVLSCVPVIVTVRNMRNAAAMDVDVSVWLHLQKSQDSVQAQNLEEESVLSCVPVIVTVRNMRNAAAMDVDVSVWLCNPVTIQG
ncbi:unnamed protein product [Leuciscus chuanchicus]